MGDYMEEKLAILLEKINLDSETKELFFNSKLSHITKKKDNKKCLFEIEIDKPINYENFLKVLNALTDTFSTFDQIALNFILKEYTSEELIKFYEDLIEEYHIISIEDGMAEEDWEGWKLLTEKIGKKAWQYLLNMIS